MEADIFNLQKFSIHDGPNIRTTVFFKGCHLRCGWCCNPEGLRKGADGDGNCGTKYTMDRLMKELLKDKAFYDYSGGGVTLSGGEFLLQADFAEELCDRLHKESIHVAAETSAAIAAKIFDQMLGKIDLWIIDFKHYDSAAHKAATGVGNEEVLHNIRSVIDRKADYIIRIPVIPGFNDSLEDARCFSRILKKEKITAVQLMPFHQLGERKYKDLSMQYDFAGVPQTDQENLSEYANILIAQNIDVQIGG